ncbi:MAG: CPBP family glutamic-type intramembrane protease [Cyclobacteriaceae bacterium]
MQLVGSKHLVYFILLLGLGLVVASLLATGVVSLLLTNGASTQEYLANPSYFPNKKYILLIAQGLTTVGTFILPSILYRKFFPFISHNLFQPHKRLLILLGIAVLVTYVIMPLIGSLYQWNMAIELPEFLSGFEKWAKGLEEKAKVATEYLTSLSNPSDIILGIVAIAILPAIGEELAFRGVLQPLLTRLGGNTHIGIIVTGIIFSAIHMQFYGFLPRMLLGILFGYLFYWSQNLWVPILAHFINNASALIVAILNKQEMIDMDENTPIPILFTLCSIGLSVVLLSYFKRYVFPDEKKISSSWQCIHESSDRITAGLIIDLLNQNDFTPVLLDKKDSAYGFGIVKVMVRPEEVLEAKRVLHDSQYE